MSQNASFDLQRRRSDAVLRVERSDCLSRPAKSFVAAPQQGARLMTRRFGLLLIAQGFFGYSFSCFFLLPKFLASELNASASDIGVITAVNGAAVVTFMFAMGVLVDRFGRRRFLTGGALLMAVSSLAFVAVHDMGPLIYSLRLLQGMAFSMAFVAGATLAVDQAPPERLGQAIGFFGLTMLSMNAIAPAMTEEIAATHGWAWAFGVASIGAVLCALFSLFVHEKPHARDAESGLASLIRIARRPKQARAAVVISLVGACFGSLFVYHQLYAIELGIEQVRIFFITYAGAAIFARSALGTLGDRLGRERVSATMLILYAVGALGMTAMGEIGLGILGAVFGLAHGVFYPTYNASVVDGTDPEERGKVIALFQGWFNAGLAAGSFFLGFVADAYGYPLIFMLSAGGVLLAFVVMVRPMITRPTQ